MKWNQVITLCVLMFTIACTQEKPVDLEEELRAKDAEMSDGTLAKITMEPKVTEALIPPSVRDHPLSAYFVPEGSVVLNHFGKLWRLCDTNRTVYSKEHCDRAVSEAIDKGKAVGIRLRRKDLVNPEYWAAHQAVFQLKKNAQAQWQAEQEKGHGSFGSKALVEYRKQFRAKEDELLRQLGE